MYYSKHILSTDELGDIQSNWPRKKNNVLFEYPLHLHKDTVTQRMTSLDSQEYLSAESSLTWMEALTIWAIGYANIYQCGPNGGLWKSNWPNKKTNFLWLCSNCQHFLIVHDFWLGILFTIFLLKQRKYHWTIKNTFQRINGFQKTILNKKKNWQIHSSE